MFRFVTTAMLLLLLLLACAPASEPEAEEGAPTGSGPALSTMSPANTPGASIEVESAGSQVTLVAPSGTVNLSELTPVVIEGGDLIVQPEPGVPNPIMALAHLASQDLARRINEDVADVHYVGPIAVEWPNSALGCPEPGMNYMDVITPGYQLQFLVGDKWYFYHTRGTEAFKYCPDAVALDPME
jgi:hypothetical protein